MADSSAVSIKPERPSDESATTRTGQAKVTAKQNTEKRRPPRAALPDVAPPLHAVGNYKWIFLGLMTLYLIPCALASYLVLGAPFHSGADINKARDITSLLVQPIAQLIPFFGTVVLIPVSAYLSVKTFKPRSTKSRFVVMYFWIILGLLYLISAVFLASWLDAREIELTFSPVKDNVKLASAKDVIQEILGLYMRDLFLNVLTIAGIQGGVPALRNAES